MVSLEWLCRSRPGRVWDKADSLEYIENPASLQKFVNNPVAHGRHSIASRLQAADSTAYTDLRGNSTWIRYWSRAGQALLARILF